MLRNLKKLKTQDDYLILGNRTEYSLRVLIRPGELNIPFCRRPFAIS
ncbi:hypothetical protein D1AOALGA4SA_10891 [Olavius algarvensis Delta 1 endosymbiont]|nr:hypothetical protein D1AOALGA4SA_10891 [Olavius algarvensis Delta 1 endosymbiont]